MNQTVSDMVIMGLKGTHHANAQSSKHLKSIFIVYLSKIGRLVEPITDLRNTVCRHLVNFG